MSEDTPTISSSPESTPSASSTEPPKTPRKRGRPKKSEVAAKTKGSRGQVGRPKGDASIMNEYKARMLASPKSNKVLEAIFNAALDDEHKNQAAAWKLVMDRVAPTALFEQDILKSSGASGISINISTVGATVDTGPKDIEGEIVDSFE